MHGQEWNVPTTTSFRTTDLDEARDACGDFFVPRSMRLLDPSASLAARFDIMWMSAVTIGDVEYGAEITGRCAHLDNYHINVPLTGGFVASQGRRAVEGSTAVASVYQPDEALTLERASVDCRILTVQIERHALEGHLAALLDAPVRGPLRLPVAMDLTGAPGRALAELVGVLAADITDPNALIHHPITAGPLQESLLTAILLVLDHQYRDALARSTAGPRASARVTAAIEAIETHPERAHTSATLAELAGVSIRGLRLGFRERLDMSPMEYLWRTRLGRVHDELRAADPHRATVREVARRWGFVNLGRLAAAYRERYGVTPAQTLHTRKRGREVSRREVRP